jgi:HK97 family phage portal protein
MNLLLYGRGNSIVVPHTYKGLLQSLEPISANRVSFLSVGTRDYRVLIDGREKDPANLLHFRHNPDPFYLWQGRGLQVSLRDVANNLKQAAATEKGFLESKWKPSVIVKVDGMIEEFSSKEGRKKLLDQYVESSEAGEPWLIPADQFEVEQIRPLSLADLAIKDTVELDKRTVASIVGVPPFVLGVGEYNRDAWNSFIQNKVRPIVIGIQQEMTKKLIISPNWYLRFNILSLMDWDIQTIYSVFGGMSDKGLATGNEVRDKLGMSPRDGLDDLRILENYIPADMIGDQKKLAQGGGSE